MAKLSLKRSLGKTGIEIPPVIFGTSALGNLYEALEDHVKLDIVRECLNHVEAPVVFDSAGKYGAGLALEMLGKCLLQLGIPEEEVIISNKLGWLQVPLTTPEPVFEKGVWMGLKHDAVQKISDDGILECWEQGNSLLRGYMPQWVSVHDPDEYISNAKSENERQNLYNNVLDAYKALALLKSEGKVRAIGVGAKDWRIIQQISHEVELDWVMFANNMTIYRHPKQLLSFMEELDRRGVGIINSAVFNAGFLIGGEYFDYSPIKADTPENKAIFKWRDEFFVLCKKHDVLPAIACVQFGLSAPGVASISLNTSNPDRVRQNVESVVAKVDPAFWKEMKEKGLIEKDYSYLGV
jgi:D-threo-aldose 1-dehydrogenase